MKYAIVDIETTGAFSHFNCITEVGIVVTDGEKILKSYESLVKPDEKIPYFITNLTGITNEMVSNAPSYKEVANHIFEFTKDCIFVAHNASFDYGFLRKAFKELDIHFYRKKICTVRMAKAVFPNLKSYSLSRLTHHFNIEHKAKHRAFGDALATFNLLKLLLNKNGESYVNEAVKKQSLESGLPSNLPKNVFDGLPEETGVYNFFNEKNEIIYIGKAKNIKQRVISHFNAKAKKQQIIRRQIYDIKYHLTGCDLCAELLESELIKTQQPRLNSAQVRTNKNWGIIVFENQNGYKRLVIDKVSNKKQTVCWFGNYYQCRKYLEEIAYQNVLCPKLCGLQKTPHHCYNYEQKLCKGACCKKENVAVYNKRVEEAIKTIKTEILTYIITDKGRSAKEKSIIMVENGKYLGFGFVAKQTKLNDFNKTKTKIEKRKDNTDIQRILKMYLQKGNLKIKMF